MLDASRQRTPAQTNGPAVVSCGASRVDLSVDAMSGAPSENRALGQGGRQQLAGVPPLTEPICALCASLASRAVWLHFQEAT